MERKRSSEPAPNEPEKVVYIIDELSQNILASIKNELPGLSQDVELQITEVPLGTGFDFGINVIKTAKESGRNPQELAKSLAEKLNSQKSSLVETTESTGPFLNFKLDTQKFGGMVLKQIFDLKDRYGKETVGDGQRVIVDMSSPNIAKRMSIGHLRSTIIGDAMANLYKSQGYEVIRDNHLGDWGTQFGKLIVAMKKWGDEKALMSSKDPIGILQDLYVKFHSEVKTEAEVLRSVARAKYDKGMVSEVHGLEKAISDVSKEIITRKKITSDQLDMEKVVEDALDRVIVTKLEDEGRNWFLKLEQGDPEAKRLWKLCVDLSMKEFNKIYKTLGVSFEKTLGESFYENKLKETIELVKNNKNASISDGALIIDMSDAGLGAAIVQKSDGASVYFTRDLACAIYRENELKVNKMVYVVGDDQKFYFQQLFEGLRKLGYKVGDNALHVYFGMIRLPEGKMSTREGRVILLKDVINEGFKRAKDILSQKNPELSKNKKLRDTVVRQVAMGALKWNDLSQDPRKTIEFSWDKALKLDGNSAPYVQYTAVRAKSILEASGLPKFISTNELVLPEGSFDHPMEKALLRKLSEYPIILSEALKDSSPSKIAAYVYEVAKRFNAFYTNVPVLKTENENLKKSRLMLTAASTQVITNALSVLGIEVPERM